MKCCSYRMGVVLEIRESSNEEYKYIIIGKNPKDIYTHTKLVYSKETLIVDCEYKEIKLEDLKVGDFVVVYHSNTMTMSIPPQTSAYIIEVK